MDYIPNTDADLQKMMEQSGFRTFDEIIAAVPERLRFPKLDLPEPLEEMRLMGRMKELAAQNRPAAGCLSFLGGGAYDHFIPSAIDHLASRGEFYTAYTPYQAEASQGTLQVIYEYQSMMCALTGLDVSNASLYDGASAAGEAAFMCLNLDATRTRLLLSSGLHPEYRQTIGTYLKGIGVSVEQVPEKGGVADLDALKGMLDDKVAAVFVQSPNFFGQIEDMEAIGAAVHEAGGVFVAVTNPLSLGLLRSPGEVGADIAVGEGQPLGIPLSFGGPYLGFFTCTKALVHKIPGRLVGRTQDTCGELGYCLTLQAREQHIRREKATSNICTNQSLMALRAAIYLSLLGKGGLREVAEVNAALAHQAALRLSRVPGFSLAHGGPFFNEFVLRTPAPARELVDSLAARGIMAGLPLDRFHPGRSHELLVCVTETKTAAQIEAFAEALEAFAVR